MPLSKSRLKTRRIGGSASAAVAGVSRYKSAEETRREFVYHMYGHDGVKKYLTIPAEAVNSEEYLTIRRAPGDVIRVKKYNPDGTPSEEYIQMEINRLETNIDNIHTRVGSFIEGFILNRVSSGIVHGSTGLPGGNDTGLLLPLNEAGDTDPRAVSATAEIDGYAGKTAHECKCILINRKSEFGAEYTDAFPVDYLFQCYHYLLWPYFDSIELHALFLTMQEKELIDAMVRGWLLENVPDDGEEHIIPEYGACTIKPEYRISALPMRKEIVERIVQLAPMGTWRLEKNENFLNIREYHLSTYADFWHRVECNIPCVAKDWRECQIIYAGRSSKKTKIADDKEKRLYVRAQEINKLQKKNEEEYNAIKAQLQASALDSERIITMDGNLLYTIEERYSAAKNEGIAVDMLGNRINEFQKPVMNWEKIKNEEPEIYAACKMKSERNIYFRKGK